MFYLKTFLIAGSALGLFYHAVTTEPMPWWPDTVIMGAFMGAMATRVAFQLTLDRRGRHHLRNAWRAFRSVRDRRI